MRTIIYRQNSGVWARLPFPGGGSTVGGSGCSLLTITHILIETEKYKNYDPRDPYEYMKQYAVVGQGLSHAGIPDTLKHYGLANVTEFGRSATMKDIFDEFTKGGRYAALLIYKCDSKGRTIPSKGPDGTLWTNGGHFVAICDYKTDSKGQHWFYIKDSSGRKNDGWFCYEKSLKGCVWKVWTCTIPRALKRNPEKTAKYTGSMPTKAEIKTASNKGITRRSIAWGRKIAADNRYRYKLWTSDPKTHKCPFCHPEIVSNWKAKVIPIFNCIGFAFACWRHGGGLKTTCNCGVIPNDTWESILKAKTDQKALEIAQNHVGTKNLRILRSNSGLKASQLEPGMVCATFSGKKYLHTWLKSTGNKMLDSTSGSTQISERKAITPKIALQYTGGFSYLQKGDYGTAVKKVQKWLIWAGYNIEADGDFGKLTKSAVKKAQKRMGLEADGKVDQATLTAMKELKNAA